ncbi:hypothetical protein B0I35DRAFT_483681 [Stachybotrys elegans]|uniref:N-terminal of MaoC-like dehydratase domain-containing protein n=1 Tax=Stachybotrys elegans TaxID=80388 RepID=A0A8K0WMD2_9HYPO|nr:hypothetical protein B0I35DRAFT_483681 [Stachybotrys elegans]
MISRAGLPRIFLRALTSTSLVRSSRITASEAAARLLDSFAGAAITRRHFIDPNQLQKLSLTLCRTAVGGHDITDEPPPMGTPLPPGHHLVYFTPNGTEAELGLDGSDKTFNPVSPFTRRMWAGDQVEERTRLLSAVPKKSKSTGEMVLVEVEREFWGPQGLALADKRSWVFRPEVTVHADSVAAQPRPLQIDEHLPTQIEDMAEADNSTPVRRLRWSPVGLFRFSALTFNGHKIHYNPDWTRTVEGHPGVVVHGPLNLINMLDYWRDIHGEQADLSDITYRAMAPIYAGEEYDIRTAGVEEVGDQQTYTILVEKQGNVCMKAEIGAMKR